MCSPQPKVASNGPLFPGYAAEPNQELPQGSVPITDE